MISFLFFSSLSQYLVGDGDSLSAFVRFVTCAGDRSSQQVQPTTTAANNHHDNNNQQLPPQQPHQPPRQHHGAATDFDRFGLQHSFNDAIVNILFKDSYATRELTFSNLENPPTEEHKNFLVVYRSLAETYSFARERINELSQILKTFNQCKNYINCQLKK